MATPVEQIKDRLSIQDIIGGYLKLQKAGINYKANCPFHSEKTPSFFVSPSRNTFYCFGCGAKGDIFEFVQRFEGLDFQGALRLLAQRANVSLSTSTYQKGGKDEKEELYKIMEETCAFYEAQLQKREDAQKYLRERGLEEKIIKNFRIGFSPPEWRSASLCLIEKGFKEKDIEKAGLTKAGNKSNYDRFRGRIMFPIMDPSGRVIAFSGRVFDKTLEGEGSDMAKYVNSPETPLYHKSRILYGFDKAKEGFRRFTYAIVVEGQMDLLMNHQAGFINAVALSGTALAEEQLILIKRFTDKLLLSLDADVAGISASGKSAAIALKKGFDVKVAHLKGGKDPADIIKENPAQWKEIIKKAKHVIQFYLDVLSERVPDNRKFRMEVSKQVLPFVSLIQNAIDKAHFIDLVAKRLSVPVGAVEEELSKIPENPLNEGVYSQSSDNNKKEEKRSRKETIIFNIIGHLNHLNLSLEAKDKSLAQLKNIIGEENVFQRLKDKEYVSETAFVTEVEAILHQPEKTLKELLTQLLLEDKKEKAEIIKKEMSRMGEADVNYRELAKQYQDISREISELQEKSKLNNF
ncbi:MAG: DNA primase [Patescibacteria group bacterium]